MAFQMCLHDLDGDRKPCVCCLKALCKSSVIPAETSCACTPPRPALQMHLRDCTWSVALAWTSIGDRASMSHAEYCFGSTYCTQQRISQVCMPAKHCPVAEPGITESHIVAFVFVVFSFLVVELKTVVVRHSFE